MKEFLLNILPRLKRYSKELNISEFVIDKPWIWVSENGDNQKMIFRRGGTLLMVKNGDVKTGSWEYISSLNSFLIDRTVDKLLMNYAFLDESIMLLKRDGSAENEVLAFVNESKVPSLDYQRYLNELVEDNFPALLKSPIIEIPGETEVKNEAGRYFYLTNLSTGLNMHVYDIRLATNYIAHHYPVKGAEIFWRERILGDGYYVLPNTTVGTSGGAQKIYHIQGGLLKEEFIYPHYNLSLNGEDVVICFKIMDKLVGAAILYKISFEPLKDGIYVYGFLSRITVVDGRIIKYR